MNFAKQKLSDSSANHTADDGSEIEINTQAIIENMKKVKKTNIEEKKV